MFLPSFIKIPPLNTETSRHAKQEIESKPIFRQSTGVAKGLQVRARTQKFWGLNLGVKL